MQENSYLLTSLLSWIANSVFSMLTQRNNQNDTNQFKSVHFTENTDIKPLIQMFDHHHKTKNLHTGVKMKQLTAVNHDSELQNKHHPISKQQFKYSGNMGIIMMKGHNNPVGDSIDSEEYSLPFLHEQANVLNTIIKNRDGNL
ncbi:hypothetical protein FDP41_008409 [Naegleria fowleri]|uniref:Uncharacterized protein n=1 Tax=Naegleria fowleri TaxID=5763 RepID=A0A6A5BEH2_NAEFO|nr:uncharacterized protein FDP41_008409 [Naegleria fowleri]KAF0973202.1 hypothetical protein FDP41_008409 [Naegleria fowleri]CAG4709573.1 unnamed protein product [Naegleria fowleri]